jgi:hypothetical protein
MEAVGAASKRDNAERDWNSAMFCIHALARIRYAFGSTSVLVGLAVSSLTFLSVPLLAQDVAHRLILKDGSYQMVTKYEVKGDRVRYYSSEREDWEELPNSLVDWPATEKFEKESAASAASPEAVELDKEAEHEHDLEGTLLPEVAPGLRLPEATGVFMLDSFEGQPQLVEIQQSSGDVNRNVKGNIFRSAIPLAGMKATVELDGTHAALQSHVLVPSIYIKLDDMPDQPGSAESGRAPSGPEQPQQPQQAQQAIVPFDRFRIIRAEVKGGKRIVLDLKRGPDGRLKEQRWTKTTVDRVTGGWLKITPTQPLAVGEYAIVEAAGKEINLGVWDFGVNPKAAANANPWKPEVKKAGQGAGDKK